MSVLQQLAIRAIGPLWRPFRLRMEHAIRAQMLPMEQQVAAMTSDLRQQIEALTTELQRRVSSLQTRQVFPLPAQQEHDSLGLAFPGGSVDGVCSVCGHRCSFRGFTDNLRESGACSMCGSFNRQRQIAHMVRSRLGMPLVGPLQFAADARVYNTETTGAFHKQLERLVPGYVSSEYFGPEHSPGADVDGRRHEDLQRLSFADESLDLVLSSDVLEHMPDPYLAHREIFRALRPGGRHIFTVPFNTGTPQDDVRARLTNGEIEYLAEKQFHGDPVRPDEGVLVWTVFGLESLLRLSEIGYVVSAWNLYEPRHGIVGHWSLVFEAAKPA